MTVVVTIATAVIVAVFQASLLPWMPFFRTLAPIGAGVVALLVVGRVQCATAYAIITSIAVAYFAGTFSIYAPFMLIAAILATIPVLQLIRSGHRTTAVVVLAIVFAIVDRGTLIFTIPTFAVVGWAACWNAVIAAVVLTLAQRRALRMAFH